MSHHGINLLPGLLPLQAPVKLKKKRRLRKVRTSDISTIGDSNSIDELFMMEDFAEDGSDGDEGDELDTGRLMLNSFSGATMRTILQAQEEG